MPYLLILLAVVARLLVHPFNFTPIGGIGLFAKYWCRSLVYKFFSLLPEAIILHAKPSV
jgi:hypothetical protein